MEGKVKILKGDISSNDKDLILKSYDYIAIDTETTGLDPLTNDLCLIQIYTGKHSYILRFNKEIEYKNLVEVLQSNKVMKVFHHANFDIRFLMKNLNLDNVKNVACTKVSAKLLNGIEESSSLKHLVKKYLGITMDKTMQISDWSNENLSVAQLEYAQNDVIYLYKLWGIIERLLKENGFYEIANKCFDYLPINSMLHNNGIENIFIY